MQSDIMMTNFLEKEYGIGVWTAVPGFLNNFIPNDTEAALEFGESIACVKFGKRFYNAKGKGLGATGMAHEMDQVGE